MKRKNVDQLVVKDAFDAAIIGLQVNIEKEQELFSNLRSVIGNDDALHKELEDIGVDSLFFEFSQRISS